MALRVRRAITDECEGMRVCAMADVRARWFGACDAPYGVCFRLVSCRATRGVALCTIPRLSNFPQKMQDERRVAWLWRMAARLLNFE
jgi:hypothetical protein